MNKLSQWSGSLGLLGKTTIALVIYSCVIIGWTVLAGVHLGFELEGGAAYKGYLDKFNWYLFPVWWLFMAMVVHLTWAPFMEAWRDIHAKGMLLDREGKQASKHQLSAFFEQMGRFRSGLLIISFAVSCAMTYFDTADLRKIYNSCDIVGTSLDILRARSWSENGELSCQEAARQARQELNRACGARGFNIGHAWPMPRSVRAVDSECAAIADSLSAGPEIDFNIAYLVPGRTGVAGNSATISREHNLLLSLAIYFQQIALGTMAGFGLLQLALLCYLFWRLERASWLNRQGLQMVLDPFSKLHEFGLESWNHALNNVYWVFALALLVPIASRSNQQGEALDFGQLVLQIGMPAILAMPMLATIIARQQRQRDLWPQILAEQDPDKVALYHRQLLWPLDRNWASKLGIILSFILLSYLLGKSLNLMSLAGG
jgi:hypothetical protein